MNMSECRSALAPYIAGLIDEKHALGYKYTSGARILKRFDIYWLEHGYDDPSLTADRLAEWVQKTDSEGTGQLRHRILAVRQLSYYLNGLSIPSYIPHLDVRREKPIRHLLTKSEINELFAQIDAHMPRGKGARSAYKRMARAYSLLFRLIYLHGMRISEACRLPVSQIDLDNGIITILDGKGSTDRLIYMAEDTRLLCIAYVEYLQRTLGMLPTWLFPGSNTEKPVSISAVERKFDAFWEKTSFSKYCDKKPTVHDLRHAFVVHRINLWLEQGLNFEHMLPYLSKFLGHKGFNETFYYYHYAEEAANTICKIDTVTARVIPEVMRR